MKEEDNMNFNYELTSKVKKYLEDANLTEISIGCSDSQVFKIEKNNEVYYLKVASSGLLTKEYNALKWLNGKLEVPKIKHYENKNNVEYLITEAIEGEMVCSKDMLKKPSIAIDIICEAFKKLEKVDISDCPFNVSLDYKLNLVKYNVDNQLVNYENLMDFVKERFSSLNEVLDYLYKNRFEEELCFSHGDVSLPNILCVKDKFSGFIDVGECGIADKWFDLAICEKSIVRNFGQEYVDEFYDKLNIQRDDKKVDYYILLMELYT